MDKTSSLCASNSEYQWYTSSNESSFTARELIFLNFVNNWISYFEKNQQFDSYTIPNTPQIKQSFENFLKDHKIDKIFNLETNATSILFQTTVNKIQTNHPSKDVEKLNKELPVVDEVKAYVFSCEQIKAIRQNLKSMEYCKKKLKQENKKN